MLQSKEIIDIIKNMDGTTVDEVHYEQDGLVIKVKNQNPYGTQESGLSEKNEESEVQTSKAVNTSEAGGKQEDLATGSKVESDVHTVKAPMVGMFYTSPSPDEDVFVHEGDAVEEDTVVCVLEAMKMFNDVHADVNGEIVEILANNGDLVEFGQPLFKVKPE
ncbi:acetyl-CoA carboxylase biotin carboxyl carrier protein [Alkalihalobacillus sp. R86527]|uniref:acetyl-CoA carboxylase biotin carboxyl carrier protein n=1 Tax=Alkalihalobacillus sp. R86527 TaxID=3093863 RepID=UPI0036730D89